MTDYDRDAIEFAVHKVLWNASNHPDPTAVWGKDITPLRDKIVDAVLAVLRDGLEATDQAVEAALTAWDSHIPDPDHTMRENLHDAMRVALAAGLSAGDRPAERRTDDPAARRAGQDRDDLDRAGAVIHDAREILARKGPRLARLDELLFGDEATRRRILDLPVTERERHRYGGGPLTHAERRTAAMADAWDEGYRPRRRAHTRPRSSDE